MYSLLLCHRLSFRCDSLVPGRRSRTRLTDHFKVVCLVAWPLNENEAGGDLVSIETSTYVNCY